MKTALITIILFSALITSAQTSNFRHDIGLRFGSVEARNFELQYRFHKNEKITYTAGLQYGDRSNVISSSGYIYPDSLYQFNNYQFVRRSYGLTVGVQRHLDFMKYNFFYVGANVGVGISRFNETNSRMTYTVSEDQSTDNYYAQLPLLDEIVESTLETSFTNGTNMNGTLFAGVDIPIIDRLSFNFEMGIMLDFETRSYNGQQTSISQMHLPITGGLRYHFGKYSKE